MRRIALYLACLGMVAAVTMPCARGAALHLLAHYGFEGNPQDSTGGQAPFEILSKAEISSGVLRLAPASSAGTPLLPDLNYRSFTVALDFKVASFSGFDDNILSGGPSHRWFGVEQRQGILAVRLSTKHANYYNTFEMPQLRTNQWYHLTATVDLDSGWVRLFLNGGLTAQLNVGAGAELNVVGTSAEPYDRVFSFRNHGNASTLVGSADNLQIYNRAASPEEVAERIAPQLRLASSGGIAFLSAPRVLTGYNLETSATPNLPSSWTTLSQTPASVGDFFIWPKQMPGAKKFFRLLKE